MYKMYKEWCIMRAMILFLWHLIINQKMDTKIQKHNCFILVLNDLIMDGIYSLIYIATYAKC